MYIPTLEVEFLLLTFLLVLAVPVDAFGTTSNRWLTEGLRWTNFFDVGTLVAFRLSTKFRPLLLLLVLALFTINLTWDRSSPQAFHIFKIREAGLKKLSFLMNTYFVIKISQDCIK